MQTLQQRYAAKVYNEVIWIRDNFADDNRRAYGTMAHKLPVLVRQAGLMQAVAFVKARGKDAQKRLLEDLVKVLGEFSSVDEFFQEVQSAPLTRYMYLTQRVLWALEWFKRFAQSELKVEPGEGE